MTVCELLEKLNRYNPNAEVMIENAEIGDVYFDVVNFAVVLEKKA